MKEALALLLVLSAAPAYARKPARPIWNGHWRLLSEAAQRQRTQRAMSTRRAGALNTDYGNVAVIQDDGTLITPAKDFNLPNPSSLLFTPFGTASYSVTKGTSSVDTASANAGQALTLADDDIHEVALPFGFTFYGQTYTTIFLNSDGNLTFNSGDVSESPRDLGRFLDGQPRLAPFFQDLNPAEGGQVTVNVNSSRAIFSWLAVPLCCLADLSAPVAQQTFQVILYPNGNIQYNYGTIQSFDAVVGISPGGANTVPAPVTPVDFTNPTSTPVSTAIAEVFSQDRLLCVSCLGQRFYSTHEDAYDEIVMFSEFSYNLSLADAFSESNPISNGNNGIGNAIFDDGKLAGSVKGRIQTIVEMGPLANFPASLTAPVTGAAGQYNVLSLLGHEVGHNWLAYPNYPYNSDPQSTILLGRALAHWSFNFNSSGSFVEGNAIQDNGDGTFTTQPSAQEYGPLDRYLMGLIAPSQVPDSFFVAGSTVNAATAPQSGYRFSGTKVAQTIAAFVQANGPRLPPSTMSQRHFNVAFVLLAAQGTTPSPSDIAQVESYRAGFEPFFATATGNNAQIHTELVKAAWIAPLPAAFGAGSNPNAPAILSLQSPAPSGGVTFQVLSSDPTIVKVPATVTVSAGATQGAFTMTIGNAGNATVTASAAGYQTISGGVSVATGAVVHAATFAVGAPVSPGSIASFFGPFLTTSTAFGQSLPLPTQLAKTSIAVNGTAVPLFYASPGQINFQVPFEVQGTYANLVVTRSDSTTLTVPLLLQPDVPGLFTVSQNGSGPVVALDGVNPTVRVTTATAGEIISVFGTGFGAVYPTVPSGTAASGISTTNDLVSATIGGVNAPVTFAGLAPGLVGLYQINVTVPAGVTGATLPLVLTIAGVTAAGPTISAQ